MEKNVYFCKIIPTVEPLDNMQYVPKIRYRCILNDMRLDFRWKADRLRMEGGCILDDGGLEVG